MLKDKYKLFERLIISIIVIVSILGISSIVNAVTVETDGSVGTFGATKANMPQNTNNGITGMLPQLWQGGTKRRVSLDDSRLNFRTNGWAATVDSSSAMVYCAALNRTIRFGQWDGTEYILKPGLNTLKNSISGNVGETSLEDKANRLDSELLNWLRSASQWRNSVNYVNIHNPWRQAADGSKSDEKSLDHATVWHEWSGNLDTEGIGYIIIASQELEGYVTSAQASRPAAVAKAQSDASATMQEFFQSYFSTKNGNDQASHDSDTTVAGNRIQGSVTAIYGPEVTVMETSEHASDGYRRSGGETFENNLFSYIFSASEEAYENKVNGNYAKKYNVHDIQTAYWYALWKTGKGDNPATSGHAMTAAGKELFDKAVEYAEQYVPEISGGYNATIKDKEARVIADRTKKQYIVGPYSLNYPFYEDLSYVKAITLNDSEELTYDQYHDGIEIVLEGAGTTIPGSNGITKSFPKPGENFFIVFSADKVKGLKKVDLDVRFEYLSQSKAKEEYHLTSNADVYQYMGYVQEPGEEYGMREGTLTVYAKFPVGKEGSESVFNGWKTIRDEQGNPIREVEDYGSYKRYFSEDKEIIIGHFAVFQPYVKMTEKVVTRVQEQQLSVMSGSVTVSATNGSSSGSGSAARMYEVDKETVEIDLTMQLGGYVWVDEAGGKEGVANGTFDGSEKLVPGMKVTLSDGQTTRTDGEGKYLFKNLDPMQQYSVTFEYNGQYYQPVKWEGNQSWYSGNWQTNSNAKDNEGERLNFNVKFESLGAYHGAYENGKPSYNKKELLEAGAIDEFGLPKGGSGAMAQYVQDSMMKAYTFDLYPTPPVFLINMKDGKMDSTAASTGFINKYGMLVRPKTSGPIEILYPKAFYVNLGLDEREQSDLAVKKDVEKVTLEINGQTHVYTYDSLENKIEQDGSWLIGVRPSDMYSNDMNKWREIMARNEENTDTPADYQNDGAYNASNQQFNANYGTSYKRELYKADYFYKVSNYGGPEIQNQLGKSKDDELEIYVTYKIMVRNQALSIRARVDELVDYYDEDLEYIDNRSYIRIGRNEEDDEAQRGIYSVGASENSLYPKDTLPGYNNLYITGLAKLNADKNSYQNYLAAGQTAYVYLTFRVKKDQMDGEDWIRLDEEVQSGNPIGVGKENIAEINAYSTQYPKGATVPNLGDVSYRPAGIVDRDSNSGNVKDQITRKDIATGDNIMKELEDDTGKAPNMRIILYRDDAYNRVIAGNVFEDARTQTIDLTTTGNGFKEDRETSINGVTVQLVELMDNGQEYIWREFGDNKQKSGQIGGVATVGQGTGSGTVSEETPIINMYNLVENHKFGESHDGDYAFKSFMPGKYVIRFYYGDTVRTVIPNTLSIATESGNVSGLNAKSYNGQDYKSTVYQKGINQNLQLASRDTNNWVNTNTNLEYIWRERSTWNLNEEILGAEKTRVSTFKQDASNNETVRSTWNAAEQRGYLYDITASDANANVSDAKDIESRRLAVNDYSDNDVTNYIAEVLASHKADYETMTNRIQLLNDLVQNTYMRAETGMMVIEVEYDTEGTGYAQESQGRYRIENVNLGLEERPKAQLAINKEITNVKLVLADGSTLFDAQNTATNVLWQKHKGYSVGYKGNFMDESKFGSIAKIREDNKNKFGFVQLTMDEELMHGATIQITYNVTVSNVGEVDYYNVYEGAERFDRPFYYNGEKSANARVVTTRADQIIDYVANNLQFNSNLNSNWHVIEKNLVESGDERTTLVHRNLNGQVEEYNTIIATESLNRNLLPELADKNNSSVTVPLVLSQLITAENDTDDLTYRNLVEIVKTSNTVGRRMEYSVVGNQDPTEAPQELDSDIAESVRILPPFGNAGRPMIIVAIVAAAAVLLVGGIIFIKKKVLKNK